jgi:hypothetical protein
MRAILYGVFISFILFGCLQRKVENGVNYDVYFGDLTSNENYNYIYKDAFVKLLEDFDEPFLIDSTNTKLTVRLIVAPAFTNPYCIRLDRVTNKTNVSYKILPDKKDTQIPFGVDNLRMTYESKSKALDSMVNLLQQSIIKNNFYVWNNEYDLSSVVDGTYYLLEILDKGKHKVILRCCLDQASFKKLYKNASPDPFIEILSNIKQFVPICLYQNTENWKTSDDLLFHIFQKDTCRSSPTQ